MAAPKKAATKAATSKTVLQEKEYRLLDFQPLTYTIKTGRDNNLLVWDEESQSTRAIKHCPNEKSIFVDEQSDKAVVRAIVFLNGLLSTKASEKTTQDFLENHPKRGILFELIDAAADAQVFSDIEEIKLDVKQAIRLKAKEETGMTELRLIVSVLNNDSLSASKMEPAEVKNELYSLVETNLNRFVDMETGEVTVFDDVDIQRMALAQHSFDSGVIQVSADGNKVMWSDNKKTICMIPSGQNHLDFFAKYLGTEESIQVAKEISKR